MRCWPGSPHPLGATWDGEGVSFALASEHASAVELCLFDHPEGKESERIPLPERSHRVFHGYFPDLRPGQIYGYRVHGPWAPWHGQLFNPQKLLLDPYAKAICGSARWHPSQLSYRVGSAGEHGQPSDVDSALYAPKSIVVDSNFAWGDDRRPRTPWSRTLIYECHVKGMTARHPGVPEALRGTYLGLSSDACVDHLLSLGVSAVQLLPVHHYAVERGLVERGLTNYWGYNSIGFFAPDARYASGSLGEQVLEFKAMVKALHRAGIEVLLDVVYNHTGEGSPLGPTLSLRGIDNANYYKLAHDRSRYTDYTGCGNTLECSHPNALQLVLDSLRYWVQEMHVDGFRFDLATALGRDPHEYDRAGRFLATLQQDPVLAGVKLIAEPWDLGPGGYQLGNFPGRWAEWNDRYRDSVRRFWRGDAGQLPELATRLAGSYDVFEGSGRGPFASVNFVTCHDGFTLADLVSYAHKHNAANGEDGRDGASENWSHNWGAEGETHAPAVLRARACVARSMLATLAFSQGVPMLSHGDELGRTQRGNNNAYCHDSELTWLDWQLCDSRRELLEFARRVFQLRLAHPVFRRRRGFHGNPVTAHGAKDVTWLRADGAELGAGDWHDGWARALGMLVHGQSSDEVDERGRPQHGDTLLLLLNGGSQPLRFTLPSLVAATPWRVLVHSAAEPLGDPASGSARLGAHALALLACGEGEPDEDTYGEDAYGEGEGE